MLFYRKKTRVFRAKCMFILTNPDDLGTIPVSLRYEFGVVLKTVSKMAPTKQFNIKKATLPIQIAILIRTTFPEMNFYRKLSEFGN